MFNKNLVITLISFLIFMILASIIKTQTLLIEKNINQHKGKIIKLENNLYESQLDYFYLSSPEYLSIKLMEISDDEYDYMDYSSIYLSLNQFLIEKNKKTEAYVYKKKTKK